MSLMKPAFTAERILAFPRYTEMMTIFQALLLRVLQAR
jgi:hypothetical protein